MKLLKEIQRSTFESQFNTIEACLEYLSNIKWSAGYNCKKCNNKRYHQGKQPFSRRCNKCGYDESATANTLFHKLKIDMLKAFGMLYEMSTSKKGANSIWLAERFGIQQKTAWLFRQKVQLAMKSSKQHPLIEEIHVDEFEIGTPQKGEQGRSKSSKKMRVVIALESRDGKCGRGYAKVIDDYSTASLSSVFEDHISKEAEVVADGWSGYKPLKEDYRKLTQRLSDKGRNFQMLHIQIRNFKNWLRGVHSYCNKEYLQKYIDEYFFRFNRRNHRGSILDKIIERCTLHKPVSYVLIQNNAI